MSRSIYVVSSSPEVMKIGIAIRPERRISTLRTSSSAPLAVEFLGECEMAAQLEARAHRILAQANLCGEWFSVSARQAIDAVMRAAAELGCEIKSQPIGHFRARAWRPPGSKQDRPFQMRVNDDFLALVDEFRRGEPDMPSRSEAIRRIVEQSVTLPRKPRPR
jgi:hypothetical protein